jgi:hypothetical protein
VAAASAITSRRWAPAQELRRDILIATNERNLSLSYRVFIVEGHTVRQISQTSFRDFYFRKKACLPQYSDRIIEIAVAICSMDGRKPKQVIRIDTCRVGVTKDGRLDPQHYLETLRATLSQIELQDSWKRTAKRGSVIDAESQFNARRWKQLHPELSGPALKSILKKLFG